MFGIKSNENKVTKEEKLQVCKEISDKIDDNGSGVVSLNELKTFILSLPSSKDYTNNLDLILSQFDPDRSGNISIKEIFR